MSPAAICINDPIEYMFERDILIIGGGPGGLSTALHIARDFPDLAPRLLVLEKEHYPRLKLCAGGPALDAEVILQQLGLDVSEIPHVDVDHIHFEFEARGLTYGYLADMLYVLSAATTSITGWQNVHEKGE